MLFCNLFFFHLRMYLDPKSVNKLTVFGNNCMVFFGIDIPLFICLSNPQ